MSGVSVAVHPQAILQIADHASRSKFFDSSMEYLCGFILGSSDGAKIEVHSSMEACIVKSGDNISIDKSARSVFNIMYKQHKQIYPTECVVGWYTCKPYPLDIVNTLREVFDSVEHSDISIRGEFVEDGAHPLKLYMTRGDSWIDLEYEYKSELAEQIAIMQLQSEGSAESQVEFTAQAFRSLDSQLECIEQYLTAMADGKVQFDAVTARKCADIAQWWKHRPAVDDEESIVEQENLGLLVGLMAETLAGFEARQTG